MALDISGFVTPEQKFEGLYKLGEIEEQKQKQAREAKVAASANKKAMQDALKNMMDPKDYFTGSLYDPQINQKLYDTYSKANEFIEKNPNATDVQLNTYMAPYLRDLSAYSVGAKTAKSTIDESMKNVPDWVDKQKVYDESVNLTFRNADKSIKDVINIPTSQFDNPVAYVIANNPELVVKSSAFDDWASKQKEETKEVEVQTGVRGAGGELKKEKITISAKPYMIPKMENGKLVTDNQGFGEMEPRYDLAVDAGKKITLNGNPVKLVTDEDYRSIIQTDPGAEAWIQGQYNLHAKDYKDATGKDIDPNSPQAQSIRKAIAWDRLNTVSGGSFKKGTSEVSQPERMPNIYIGGDRTYDPTGGGRTTGVIWDEMQPMVGVVKGKSVSVKNGSATLEDGTAFSGNLTVDKKNLPSGMVSVLEAGGIRLADKNEFVFKDGVAVAMKSDKGLVNRDDIVRYQKILDKEGKGQSLTYGAQISAEQKQAAKGEYKEVKKINKAKGKRLY